MTKPFRVVAGSILLVGAGAFAWAYFDLPNRLAFSQAAARLPAMMAQARELGLPVTADEVVPGADVDDDANAAVGLVASVARFLELPLDTRVLLRDIADAAQRGEPDALRQGLDLPEPTDEILDRVAASVVLEHVDFGRDWSLGNRVSFPDAAGTKFAVRMFALRALARAANGDWDRALDDLAAGYRTCRVIGADPTIQSFYSQVSSEAVLFVATERLLGMAAADKNRLEPIVAVLADNPATIDFPRAMRHELYSGMVACRDIRGFLNEVMAGSPEEKDREYRRLVPRSLSKETIGDAYQARLLEFWIGAYRSMEQAKNPREMADRLLQASVEAQRSTDPTQRLNRYLVPVYDNMGAAVMRNIGQRHAVETLGRALLFRASKGRFPDSLEEMGTVLEDPFTGRPLFYRRSGDTVLIYSADEDGEDDGGTRGTRRPGVGGIDLVASYPPGRSG
ncbi:MAG: hypothetical protein SNJ74_07895 [Fimbriimonadaceae bacterium]